MLKTGFHASASVVALLIAGSASLPGRAQSPAQGPDPRAARIEERIAALKPFAHLPACSDRPEQARWRSAGTADHGRPKPLISAHRGGNTLAPENTLDAYEAAFAYGVDFIEVDIRETKDGQFVANHDDTVDRTTGATGKVADLTLAEAQALNAANYGSWKGGPFDPSRIATLDEVLALAKRAGAGLELDIKIGAAAHGRIAQHVAAYGLTEKSIFNSSSADVLKTAPGARLIYNRDGWEEPALLYKVASVSPVFGSKLSEYTPEAIAAIHDACGLVMPHAYDLGAAQEAAQFLAARAIGADGVQTNQPALIVATAGTRVVSRLNVEQSGGHPSALCLVNGANGMGFLGKTISLVSDGRTVGSLTTTRHGCARLDSVQGIPAGADVEARFDGDSAVMPSRVRIRN